MSAEDFESFESFKCFFLFKTSPISLVRAIGFDSEDSKEPARRRVTSEALKFKSDCFSFLDLIFDGPPYR